MSDDPLTGECARCGRTYDQHPGGFCPGAVDAGGQISIATAHENEFVPIDDPVDARPEPPLMKCGHAANATMEGGPVCVICYGISPGADVADESPLDLTGRKATCPYCSAVVDSSRSLAFFEHRPNAETDSFYSGCRGWD